LLFIGPDPKKKHRSKGFMKWLTAGTIKMPLRHYWNSSKKQCDCGNKERVIVKGQWVCINKLNEELNKQGFRLQKVKGDRTKTFDATGTLI